MADMLCDDIAQLLMEHLVPPTERHKAQIKKHVHSVANRITLGAGIRACMKIGMIYEKYGLTKEQGEELAVEIGSIFHIPESKADTRPIPVPLTNGILIEQLHDGIFRRLLALNREPGRVLATKSQVMGDIRVALHETLNRASDVAHLDMRQEMIMKTMLREVLTAPESERVPAPVEAEPEPKSVFDAEALDRASVTYRFEDIGPDRPNPAVICAQDGTVRVLFDIHDQANQDDVKWLDCHHFYMLVDKATGRMIGIHTKTGNKDDGDEK